jgi:hypothetical protein
MTIRSPLPSDTVSNLADTKKTAAQIGAAAFF